MRYDSVERHRGRWPVRLTCRVLRVSAGGYCDRRGRPKGSGSGKRGAPAVAIEAVRGEVGARYGSPRIHAEPVARGMPCGVNAVARLMRAGGAPPRRGGSPAARTDSSHDRPAAENALNRRSEPGAADRARTADITPIATGEGRLCLAAVEGLYSKRIVGRSMGPRIGSRLAVDALEMAASRRLPARDPSPTRTAGAGTPSSTTRGP